MKTKIIYLLLIIPFLSHCQNNLNNKADILYKQASEIFRKYPYNNDSLLYAIDLLDSASRLDYKQSKFYFTKTQISMRIKRYDLVISSCNYILKLNKNDFLATFEKGIAFDLSNNSDSATDNYKRALDLLEIANFKTPIFKEYERIILLGLLNDTVNFSLNLDQFKSRYKADKEFPAYYDDLIHFNRTSFIYNY